eukprot:CAMPEP_0172308098 /NCGR_PEP_ID=MMETSP1058-20130122/8807_1 /TAXON_ID=83371 /ORGANISM="Detonula confervacea, Strain CCMP 353" /LENGTH=72 /DNA_ID=CAMNT_0013020451 /DNA_START=404 /DNA_END=619 /DNA_ORIENTATION=-
MVGGGGGRSVIDNGMMRKNSPIPNIAVGFIGAVGVAGGRESWRRASQTMVGGYCSTSVPHAVCTLLAPRAID